MPGRCLLSPARPASPLMTDFAGLGPGSFRRGQGVGCGLGGFWPSQTSVYPGRVLRGV